MILYFLHKNTLNVTWWRIAKVTKIHLMCVMEIQIYWHHDYNLKWKCFSTDKLIPIHSKKKFLNGTICRIICFGIFLWSHLPAYLVLHVSTERARQCAYWHQRNYGRFMLVEICVTKLNRFQKSHKHIHGIFTSTNIGQIYSSCY